MKSPLEKTDRPSRRTFLQTALGALAAEHAGPAWGEPPKPSGPGPARETRLSALPQFLRPDPFGGIVRADRSAARVAGVMLDGEACRRIVTPRA